MDSPVWATLLPSPGLGPCPPAPSTQDLCDECVPPSLYIKVLTPAPQDMTVFGDGICTKELRENVVAWVGPTLICLMSL